MGLIPSAAILALGAGQADALSAAVSWQAGASPAAPRFILFIFVKNKPKCTAVPIWAIVDSEVLAWPGEGNWLPVQGDAWHPLSDHDRGDAVSKMTVECSTIDLLCCSVWKFIFLLQANSCSNFWNSWIPQWGETFVTFWNSGSYLKVKFQYFRSSPGFPLYLSVCNFGSWSLREAEVAQIACVLCLSWNFWQEMLPQGSLLVASNLPFHLGLWSTLAKSMFGQPGSGTCEGWAQAPAQCPAQHRLCWISGSGENPMLGVP